MPDASELKREIEARLDDHAARIRDYVRQPSISLERQALDSGAAGLAEGLADLGCADAEVVDLGDGYPGVWGRLDFGRPKTVLIYGHYDVRPVGTEPWTYKPFEGVIGPFDGFPKAILARGAAAKGPLMAFICAMKTRLDLTGSLPVNLAFLIEGAEILGSPNYAGLVEAKRDKLSDVTALYGPRSGQGPDGTVGFSLGYKGMVYFDMVASSEAWGRGPAGGSVHSSTNVLADNPAWRLVQAMATIADPETGEIAVPALREAVSRPKPIATWEEPLVQELADRLTANDPNTVIPGLNPAFPVRRFKGDVEGRDMAERYLYGAAINVSSLRSGYTGPGTKSFLLPHEARATLDLRVVSETPADALVAMLRKHLDDAGFADVALEIHSAYDWNQTAPGSDLVSAATSTLQDMGMRHKAWPIQAFGGPWAHYGRVFGIPALQGGAPGLGARAATSDEYFVLEGKGGIAGLAELEVYYNAFLDAYAAFDTAAEPRPDAADA